jgi:beta-glucosidase
MKNSHEVIDSRLYTVTSRSTGRASDLVQATNRFDDAAGDVKYISRADWSGTFPQGRAAVRPIPAAVMAALQNTSVPEDPNAKIPVYAKHGLTLADVQGLPYDDPKWDQLLEQLSVSDMAYLIGSSGWQSPPIASVGKPAVLDIDGPAGLNGLINGTTGNQYPSEVVVASTWNTALVEEAGQSLGDEAVLNGVSGLYGPAMNTHRTPFGGRNFEYYAEDGLLAGKIGAAMVRGVSSRNIYTYIKHFALDDQETNVTQLAIWSNEQAIREVYLRSFEITVKEGHARAVMSSWNCIGATWTGASRALLTDVLRRECGFVGMVITDNAMMGSYMDADMAVAAGNDLMLSPTSLKLDMRNTVTGQQNMRAASHNILYTVANSTALDAVRPGLPGWAPVIATINIILLGLIAWGYMGCSAPRKGKKKSR